MITHHHERKHHVWLVILIALLIHFLLTFILFIAELQNTSVSMMQDLTQVPVVFEPPAQTTAPPTLPQPQTNPQDWASTTAGASQFGLPQDQEIVEIDDAGHESQQETLAEENPETKNAIDSTQEDAPDQELIPEEPAPVPVPEKRSPTTFVETTTPYTEKVPPARAREQKKKARNRSLPLTEEQKKAAQALAQLSAGYLEHIGTQGNHMVTLVGGTNSHLPTAEQLKYERYWAKLQWSLQSAIYGYADRYQQNKKLQCVMRVMCSITRDGKLANLKILDSSGDNAFDTYIHYAFTQASTSFPPLPAYIKEDPYSMIWLIQVDINNGMPMRWSMH